MKSFGNKFHGEYTDLTGQIKKTYPELQKIWDPKRTAS